MAKVKTTGNGSGSVYPRRNRDGKITSYLGSYFGPDGKRRYVSGKTKTEAREALRAAMGDADRGLVYDAGNLTVARYLDNWLGDIEGTVSNRTHDGYAGMVRNHISPTLGKNLLKNLTPNHVRGLYKEKVKTLSPRSVRYIHTTLHKALKQAVMDGLIPRNVTHAVKSPQLVPGEVRPLNRDEAKILLGAAPGTG